MELTRRDPPIMGTVAETTAADTIDFVSFNGGIAAGLNNGTAGGRAGMRIGW